MKARTVAATAAGSVKSQTLQSGGLGGSLLSGLQGSLSANDGPDDAPVPETTDEASLGSASADTPPALAAQDDPSTPSQSADMAAQTPVMALSAPAAQVQAEVSSPPAASAQTIANLSAQIAQKGGQTSRFDVQLDPLGLGRVNVSVVIDAKGAMSAALSFEKSDTAALLKSHSAELQSTLAKAGFDLSNTALSFSTTASNGGGGASQTAFLGGGGEGGERQAQNGQAQSAGRAFGAARFAADQADQTTTAARTLSARGLDIRI